VLSPNTTYYWRINAKDSAGLGPWSHAWSFTTAQPTSVQPSTFSCNLKGLSTNPSFITYAIPMASKVVIKIYDLRGKLIKKMSNSVQQPGRYQVPIWTLKMSKGYYMLDFSAGSYIMIKKMGYF
jgi:hypothetical protein